MADELRVSQQHLEVGYQDDWNNSLRLSQQNLEVGHTAAWGDLIRVSQQNLEVGYTEPVGGGGTFPALTVAI